VVGRYVHNGTRREQKCDPVMQCVDSVHGESLFDLHAAVDAMSLLLTLG